jgi:putative transposase
MIQYWRYRAYPTPEQQDVLTRTFGCVRFVYNWGLAARTAAFKAGKPMNYAQSDAALTVLKRQPETVWLNEVHCTPLQQSLRDLQNAFANFFAKWAGYPRFKKRTGRQTARFTRNSFRVSDGRRLKIGKIGVLRLRWDRNLPSAPSSITIIREPTGHYYVAFAVTVDVSHLPKTGRDVGIDFGVARLAVLSTGETVPNPKHDYKHAKRIAFLQRRLARKLAGSKRREVARRAVARATAKVSNSRNDTLNKLTTRLVKEFDVIMVEDLNLRGMVKNHTLARSLRDASIGKAVRMIEQKAERYGKRMIRVDRFFPSSKTCSSCGHVLSTLGREVREWTCPECGVIHDRDLNAAKNILAVGQTVAAHGFGVRGKARERGARLKMKCEPFLFVGQKTSASRQGGCQEDQA